MLLRHARYLIFLFLLPDKIGWAIDVDSIVDIRDAPRSRALLGLFHAVGQDKGQGLWQYCWVVVRWHEIVLLLYNRFFRPFLLFTWVEALIRLIALVSVASITFQWRFSCGPRRARPNWQKFCNWSYIASIYAIFGGRIPWAFALAFWRDQLRLLLL